MIHVHDTIHDPDVSDSLEAGQEFPYVSETEPSDGSKEKNLTLNVLKR